VLFDIAWLFIVVLVAVAGIGGLGWLNATRRLKNEQQPNEQPTPEEGTTHVRNDV
jgi:hypothetical protein